MAAGPPHQGKQPCTLLSTLHPQALLHLTGYPEKAICVKEKVSGKQTVASLQPKNLLKKRGSE